jgi:hypothetical protein
MLLPNTAPTAALGRPRLTRPEIDERQAVQSLQDDIRRKDREERDEAGRQAI